MASMRVMVAPDKFRGTLTAPEVAEAIEAGWKRARPADDVARVPLADGGEGTLETLVAALDGERRTATVTGPLGEPVEAAFGLARTDAGVMGVVEMAAASGLELVPQDRRDPRVTTTYGTGELIMAAVRAGATRIVVTIGGSATNDAGAGMAQALGVRLLDAGGRELAPGGAALLELDRVDVSGLADEVREVEFLVASDVDNPLTGPQGASVVYGPQKGASPEDVELLDRALRRFAEVVRRDVGEEVADRPGAGAAGGIGAGLMAFLGAKVRPGAALVMDAVGFRDRIREADLVITGEGKLDEQSLRGKTPAAVLEAGREAGVPVVIVCGQAAIEVEGVEVASLAERVGLERAMGETRPALEELAEDLAARAEELAGART
jgi:glycerate kinase